MTESETDIQPETENVPSAAAPTEVEANATSEGKPESVGEANAASGNEPDAAPVAPAAHERTPEELAELEEAVAAMTGEEAPVVRRPRREPPPIPEIPGVEPDQVIKALAAVWKAATDRETPTFRQTLEEGVVRVDVDAVAGYLAVTTESDSHRAIGVRRDMVAPLTAALTARTVKDVESQLAKGPAKITNARAKGS